MEQLQCEIEATVCSGLELMAKEEAEERLPLGGAAVTTNRGRVNFTLGLEHVRQVSEMRSVDNLMHVVSRFPRYQFSNDLPEALNQIRSLVPLVDWTTALLVWAQFFSFPHPISAQPAIVPMHPSTLPTQPATASTNSTVFTHAQTVAAEGVEGREGGEGSKEGKGRKGEESREGEDCTLTDLTASLGAQALTSESMLSALSAQSGGGTAGVSCGAADHKASKNPLFPSFRATCYRTGTQHAFQSPQAAACFGGAIQDYFGWNVDLVDFDLEVVLCIDDDDVRVGVALTRESLHRRDIVKFGPTTLRPTIAYGMLRLCKVQRGELLCDPMCGGASIPLEAAVNWPAVHHICGDISAQCTARSVNNIRAYNLKRAAKQLSSVSIDVVQWDSCTLPLLDQSVDVLITDLPFGKRSGSWQTNWQLYPRVLHEWARVCKPGTGRACLLTHDKKCMGKSLQALSRLWTRGPTVGVNIGGLASCIYLLYRTSTAVTQSTEPALTQSTDSTVTQSTETQST